MSATVSPAVPLPHPRGRLPLIGDVLTLDLARPTQQAARDARRLGPIFERRVFAQPVIVVSGAELIAEVSNEDRWAKHVGAILKPLRQIAGPAGLFTAFNDAPAWGAAHRVLARGFTQDAMRGYHPTMLTVVDELVDYWHGRDGQWIDVVDDANQLALEIIGRAGFGGYSFGGFAERGPFGERLRRGLTYLNRTVNLPAFVKPTLLRRQTAQHHRDIAFLHRVVDDILAAQRAASASHPADLLGLMLTTPDPATGDLLDEASIHSQCITMLVAGHETSAAALAFALHALATHPSIADRARVEIGAVVPQGDPIGYDDVARLRFLRRIIDETLRLWPVAPGFFREATMPVTVAGHEFARGDWVFVLTLAAHRDPSTWGADADQFDPDRWLPDRLRQLGPHIYKPWGVGPRACIGRAFALHEVTLALARILHEFDLHPEPRYELVVDEQITLKPRALRLRLTPR